MTRSEGARIIIEIEGRELPGLRCRPDDAGRAYENVHVGPGSRGHPFAIVAGNAAEAGWPIEVRVVADSTGGADFRGDLVEGRAGDRFLYLNWGELAKDGSFSTFRRAKIGLSEIPDGLVGRALQGGGRLGATVNLTDESGNPRCARVRAPHITWRYSPA